MVIVIKSQGYQSTPPNAFNVAGGSGFIQSLLESASPPWPSAVAPHLPALAALATLGGAPPAFASGCLPHNSQRCPMPCAAFRFPQSWPEQIIRMWYVMACIRGSLTLARSCTWWTFRPRASGPASFPALRSSSSFLRRPSQRSSISSSSTLYAVSLESHVMREV